MQERREGGTEEGQEEQREGEAGSSTAESAAVFPVNRLRDRTCSELTQAN